MAIMMGNLYEAPLLEDHQKQLADIRSDLAVVKTLLGIIIAGVVTLILKGFFG